MLRLFDTGRMAKKFGKWRGAVTVVHGVGVSIVGVLTAKLDDLVYQFAPQVERPIDGAHLALIALAIYCTGVLLGIWGAYQLLMDATRGSYISDADRYEREGW